MEPNSREIAESPAWQGKDEEWAYKLDTTNWGGNPSSPECKIFNNESGEDLSAINLKPEEALVESDNIISPRVFDLIPGLEYRLEFRWVANGNTMEAYLIVNGQR